MPEKFPVTVWANNASVVVNDTTRCPDPSQEFKDWMETNNTGIVTTSGWTLTNLDNEPHFTVTWYFASADSALLFKLTWV